MRKVLFLVIACVLVCLGAYRWGDVSWEKAKYTALEQVYVKINSFMIPYLNDENIVVEKLVYQDIERVMMPSVSLYRDEVPENVIEEPDNVGQDMDETEDSEVIQSVDRIDTEEEIEEEPATETTSSSVMSGELQKKTEISRIKLQEFDYVRQNFYQVDNTTTISGELLNVQEFLSVDMKLKEGVDGPQILIYHTHSQEAYADSVPGDESTSVVALGVYLEQLLEEKYGIEVLHHKGKYDVEKRDSAYANALPNIEQILKENPTIEVVIDLHRDGVAQGTHLVSEINGKETAQIMFFNGLSWTTSQGELENLANPYIQENLAFSFQMQLAATEYYPGLARRIYLKGYRYNMHLCPKTLLVEVGAQTNTFQEAKNAIEPLADILALVLTENSSN